VVVGLSVRLQCLVQAPSCLHEVRQILCEDLVVLTGGDDGLDQRGTDGSVSGACAVRPTQAAGSARARGRKLPRRTFTPEYKLSILAEYDRCTVPGDKGALLRREGLYSSLIVDWRRQHREGSLVPSPGRSEGGRGGPSRTEVERLRAENERLKRKLAKAEAVIEVQGKVHELLERLSRSEDNDPE
jgi:transposase